MNNIKTIIVTSASALLLAGSAVVATATSVNQNASALDETVSSGNTVSATMNQEQKQGLHITTVALARRNLMQEVSAKREPAQSLLVAL